MHIFLFGEIQADKSKHLAFFQICINSKQDSTDSAGQYLSVPMLSLNSSITSFQ